MLLLLLFPGTEIITMVEIKDMKIIFISVTIQQRMEMTSGEYFMLYKIQKNNNNQQKKIETFLCTKLKLYSCIPLAEAFPLPLLPLTLSCP